MGNLQNFVYPNGVTHAYSYDTLNRLTQVGTGKNSTAISNYAYTLGAAGNRLTVAELSGRTVNYAYDSLYRLTSETVANDPANKNAAVSYTYDNVGNRKTLNATLPPAGAMNYSYDVDDRLVSDQYDADGNTVSSGGTNNTYDFENHLIQHGGVTLLYDGNGNRVSETVGGVTTNYLVDTQNPTGYAQVVDELQGGAVSRTYSYGLERIKESQSLNSVWTTSFYGYDGHGSVRQLTNSAGVVTDTYDFDAFGNLISSTGSTPNVYLFAGEAYDAALGLYYNRARYYNNTTGRFWSMDTFEGDPQAPLSLHKYLYGGADPVDRIDPNGHDLGGLTSLVVAVAIVQTLTAISISLSLKATKNVVLQTDLKKEFVQKVTAAAQQHAAAIGSGSGWLNNPKDWLCRVKNFLGLGKPQACELGCLAWQDWTDQWIHNQQAHDQRWADNISDTYVYYWELAPIFIHNLIRARIALSTPLILDPWRDPANPVWEESDYEHDIERVTFGESHLIDGQFTLFE